MEIKTIAILVPEFVLSVCLSVVCLSLRLSVYLVEANGSLKPFISNTCHTDNQLDKLYLLYHKNRCLGVSFSVYPKYVNQKYVF